MASRALQVLLIGKDQGAMPMLDKLGQKVDDTGKKTSSFGSLAGTAFAAAGVAAAAFAVKMAGQFSTIGGEVRKLRHVVGGTPEEMSKLRFAAQQTGVDVDSLAKGLGIFEKKLVSSTDPLKDFGVQTRYANGELRPMSEILPALADKFASMPNGAQKTALALKLFGRSGADLIPLLNKGSAGLEEFNKKAAEMGLVLSGDQLEAVQKNKAAQRDLTAALDGLSVKVGGAVLPMMTKFTETLAKIPGPVADALGPVVALGAGLLGVAVVGSKVYSALGPVVGKLREMSTSTNAAGEASSTLGRNMAAAGGVAAAAAVAYALVANRLKEGEENAAALGDVLHKKLGNVTSMDHLRTQIGQIREQQKQLADEAASSRAPWDVFYRKDLAEYNAQLHLAEAAAADLQNRIGRYSEENHVSAERARQAVMAADRQKEAHKALAEAVGDTEAAIKEYNDALHAALDPEFAAVDATEKNRKARADAAKAQRELTQAQKDYDYATRVFLPTSQQVKDATEKLTEAQDKKKAADDASVRSAMDLDGALFNLKTRLDTGNLSLDEARGYLDRWVAAGYITRDQADRTAWSFLGVASSVSQANAQLGALASVAPTALAALSKASVSIASIDPTAGAAKLFAHAGGGTMQDGEGWVGELGPERFRKRGSVVEITPAGASTMGGGRPGGGDVIVNVNVGSALASKKEIGDTVLAALRHVQRTSSAPILADMAS